MISVVIPTYNHGRALKKCLLALAKQKLLPGEVIIVDDGSTDRTEQMIEKYRRDARLNKLSLRYVKANHKGAPAARNLGATLSSKEQIIFLDADIIAKPEMLAVLAEALNAHPEASYAYGSFRFGRKFFQSQPFDANALRRQNYIHTSALLRKELFPGFDETLSRFQDWDLWLTMLEAGRRGVFVNRLLFRARTSMFRRGISQWKPRIMYIVWEYCFRNFDFAPKWYRSYNEARQRVINKHKSNL